MGRVLVVYGTGEGHSDDVVAALTSRLHERGVDVQAVRIASAPSTPDGFDAVVVGSSIHVGKHDHHVIAWIEGNLDWLRTHPSAFFQVSMSSAADTPEGDQQAHQYVDGLVASTGWHPDVVALVGGALLYTRYGFVKRHLMKTIAQKQGLESDLHRDYDFTDYDAVRQFADDVAALAD